MEEVLDYVLWEIRRSGYERKLIGGVVLTGGGALMAHAEQLTELHTGMSCRIGVPVEHLAHGYQERVSSPIFSTSIGLLLRGLQDLDPSKVPVEEPKTTVAEEPKEPSNVSEEKGSSWFDNVFRKTKEWFEAEPDMDFKK